MDIKQKWRLNQVGKLCKVKEEEKKEEKQEEEKEEKNE